MILEKLDKRHTGHQHFQYLIKFHRTTNHIKVSDLYEEFCEMRNWMIDTYGHSCELDMYMSLRHYNKKHNTKWCWATDERKLRLYITEELVAWISLKYTF